MTVLGRITRIKTNENMKAGNGPQNLCFGPKDSMKKTYSLPLLGITVPSSANASAPKILDINVSLFIIVKWHTT